MIQKLFSICWANVGAFFPHCLLIDVIAVVKMIMKIMITEENDYIHDINELDKENIVVVQRILLNMKYGI